MASTYDRYAKFRSDGEIKKVPFVKIEKQSSDFFEQYEKGVSRLDLISYKYYDNPNYGWLILQANPEVGSMEYEIEDNSTLRIPYPLGTAIENYIEGIEKYKKYYANE